MCTVCNDEKVTWIKTKHGYTVKNCLNCNTNGRSAEEQNKYYNMIKKEWGIK